MELPNMKNKFLLFSFLAFLLLSINVSFGKRAEKQQPPPQQPQVTNPSDEQTKLFETIKGKFDAGDYAGARLEAVRFIESYPSSNLCPEAQYIIAMSYLKEGNEPSAREELDKLIKNYPSSQRIGEASSLLRSLEAKRFQEIISAQHERQTALEEEANKLAQTLEALKKTVARDKIYIVIDVEADLLMVKIRNATLYSFPCATGKGEAYLPATARLRSFTTPKGRHTIIKKEKDPVWYRPDWYWLERGLEVPEGITMEQRAVRGHLGKYKLDIGEAFYIHGYQGIVKPGKYTHGCIRVNEGDLEILWNLTEVGTEVYIF
jgi:L,D-transpeptidase YbiS